MLESFTVHTFSGRVGEAFRIHPGDEDPLEVELITATDLSEKPGEASRGRPFSIVFRGPRDFLLPQRTYRVEHAGIGAFDLFLVPIGPDEKGLRYEAVFT